MNQSNTADGYLCCPHCKNKFQDVMTHNYICPFCNSVLDEHFKSKTTFHRNQKMQDYVELQPDKELFEKRSNMRAKKFYSNARTRKITFSIGITYVIVGFLLISFCVLMIGIFERDLRYTIPGGLTAAVMLYGIFSMKDQYEYDKELPGYTDSNSLIPIRYFNSPYTFGITKISANCNYMDKEPTISFKEFRKRSVYAIRICDYNGEPEYWIGYHHETKGIKHFTIPIIFTSEIMLKLFPMVKEIEDKRKKR